MAFSQKIYSFFQRKIIFLKENEDFYSKLKKNATLLQPSGDLGEVKVLESKPAMFVAAVTL